MKDNGANPNLTVSTPQSQDVSETSIKPGHPVNDKVRGGVEYSTSKLQSEIFYYNTYC